MGVTGRGGGIKKKGPIVLTLDRDNGGLPQNEVNLQLTLSSNPLGIKTSRLNGGPIFKQDAV